MKRTRAICSFLLMGLAFRAFPLDFFAEGQRLFRENKPAEAIPLLYQASLTSGTDPRVYTYLGLCYQQTGKYPDAISIFMKGSSAPGTDRKVLFFNAGNVYFIQELYSESETMYSNAIGIDSAYAPAWLNRANSRVKLKKFALAIDDYNMYLMLDPATWQKDSIVKLVSLLSAEKTSAEEAAQRVAAQKAAAEAEKAAADERYRKMLDTVSSSLQAVDGASTLSAGSEDIMSYNEEGQLE
jgi:tetratricopeptide (TPR) repeat protein